MMSFTTKRPKIGIFRALQLGDLLCTIPAIRGLRQAFAGAEIVWIGLPWTSTFVERFPAYIDRCITFPGYPGLPEQPYDPAQWEIFIQQVQAEAFDLILQMQGNGTIVNDMLQQFGAKQLGGYHPKDSPPPSPLFMEYPNHGHEINRHLRLMQHLGICCPGPDLEFPIAPEEEAALHTLIALQEDEKYVCIHPGSRGSWRQWPPKAFAALADQCAQQGYTVFITGTADEKPITEAVQQHMQQLSINLAGKTKLGVLAALLRHASLLVANCTGVSHMAAALHTPSLVISMDGEPHRWAPLNSQLHTTIDCTTRPDMAWVQQELEDLLQRIPHARIY